MSKAQKRACECGCGKFLYHNQLVGVTVTQAIDKTLTRTEATKAFMVTRECKVPYEEELGYMIILNQLVLYWAPKQKTPLEKLNIFRTFGRWCRRVMASRQVMRLSHAINERNKGFAEARRHAIASAVLLGCPRFLQGWYSKRLLARAKRRKEIEDARPRNITRIEDAEKAS